MNVDPANTSNNHTGAGLSSRVWTRQKRTSELNAPAWHRLLIIVAGCILTWAAQHLLGGETAIGTWVIALLAAGVWLTAIRFLLLDTKGRKFWIWWLAISAVPMFALSPDPSGRYLAITFAGIFLLLRRYRPYQYLTGGRRAKIFLLGLAALAAISFGPNISEMSRPAVLPWFHGLGDNLGHYAIGSLRLFWVFSLLNLFFRMRLHSMRLKPKLAVSALFIAIVPVALVAVFGVLTLFGAMGGSRATRGHAILDDWSEMLGNGMQFTSSHFDTPFSARVTAGQVEQQGVAPAALADFLVTLSGPPSPEGVGVEQIGAEAAPDSAGPPAASVQKKPWTPADTTAYFVLGPEIWLLQLRGIGSEELQIDGYRVNEVSLHRLAELLHCDIGLYSNPSLSIGDQERPVATMAETDSSRFSIDIQGRLNPSNSVADTSGGLWQRRLRFGADLLGVIRLTDDRFQHDQVILHLQICLADLANEFVLGEHELNQALVAVLAVIAAFFFVLQGFALFLGVRIATGIISGVKALHRGTVRLASGDLQTRIDVPNEDEFGDLADSFNEMTAAVRHGREEAVARERLERELETAREIQKRLLPAEIPAIPGFGITGTSIPSRQVGGDYFDFLTQEDGRLGIAIGDVSGKGIPAALLMSNLQASLQGQVIHPSSVGEIVARVNNLLAASTDPHMFATFFYGVLDPSQATLTATNAGHDPPILRRADGSVETLDAGGLVLGMLPGQTYHQATVTLEPGDFIVFYTDGITEAVGPSLRSEGLHAPSGADESEAGAGSDAQDGSGGDPDADNMFGLEQLLATIQANADQSAAGIKDAILAAVARHTAGTPQSDDITLVVIKRQTAENNPNPGDRPA